jgi:hypothetical protein
VLCSLPFCMACCRLRPRPARKAGLPSDRCDWEGQRPAAQREHWMQGSGSSSVDPPPIATTIRASGAHSRGERLAADAHMRRRHDGEVTALAGGVPLARVDERAAEPGRGQVGAAPVPCGAPQEHRQVAAGQRAADGQVEIDVARQHRVLRQRPGRRTVPDAGRTSSSRRPTCLSRRWRREPASAPRGRSGSTFSGRR